MLSANRRLADPPAESPNIDRGSGGNEGPLYDILSGRSNPDERLRSVLLPRKGPLGIRRDS